MRLEFFLVKNFRSVEAQRKIPVSTQSIIIGPNNEGKSNILRALHLGMKAIEATVFYRMRITQEEKRRHPVRSFAPREIALDRAAHRTAKQYLWEREFPKKRQQKTYKKAKKTEIILDFSLTEEEKPLFYRTTKVKLLSTLPIKVEFGRDGLDGISIIMPGPSKRTLDNQISRICDFVSSRISFEHFPSIRTATAAEEIVSAIVNSRLESIDDEKLFEDFLKRVKKQYDPVLEDISREIEETLRDFVPNVQSAKISVDLGKGLDALRSSVQVHIDDGVETPIRDKGDGVQSLVSLALMKYSSKASIRGKQLILALEEPESHLHPEAIHQISDIIERLSSEGQIVVTTHCPLLVDRLNISSNIIVDKSDVREAKNISEIRDILGVRVGDDLRSAQIVLFVEGISDKRVIEAYLQETDIINRALKTGIMSVEILGTASTLSYRAQVYKSLLCEPCCILDNDGEGRLGIERAIRDSSIGREAAFVLSRLGMGDSELEDFINSEIWKTILVERYGVPEASIKSRYKGKWSERVANYFADAGRPFNKSVLNDIKREIADEAVNRQGDALDQRFLQPFETFRNYLVEKLRKIEKQ